MSVEKQIKELRFNCNFTQEYLAHELGISQKTYSNIESGKSKITLTHLKKLADIYNLQITELFKFINNSNYNIKLKGKKEIQLKTSDGLKPNSSNSIIYNLEDRIRILEKLVDSKQNMIQMLKEKIRHLGK
jgi:transcriptional regulator with XRE-family HTH domain